MHKAIRVIKDPDVAKLLADNTRRCILHLLRNKEMSTTDSAKSLEKSHSSISHHLNLLQKVRLVEKTRTEKVGNMVQPYYRSTARHFHVSYTLSETLGEETDYVAWREGLIQGMLEGLEAFNIDIPPQQSEHVKRLIELPIQGKQKPLRRQLSVKRTKLTLINI